MSAPRKRGDSEGKRVCTVSQRPCSYSADRKRTFRGGETDLIRRLALADQRARLSCRRGCSMALMDCTVISASASSRSEEHTTDLQSLMRISDASLCLQTTKTTTTQQR